MIICSLSFFVPDFTVKNGEVGPTSRLRTVKFSCKFLVLAGTVKYGEVRFRNYVNV